MIFQKIQAESMMRHNFTKVPDDIRYDLKVCGMLSQVLGVGTSRTRMSCRRLGSRPATTAGLNRLAHKTSVAAIAAKVLS